MMSFRRSIFATAFLAAAMVAFHPMLHAAAPSLTSFKELRMSGINRQTKDYSCGAAALSILLTLYFEDPIGEEDILSDIVYRLNHEQTIESMIKGFSMYDLKLASHRLGYSASGVKLSIQSIAKLQGPVILLLQDDKLNHFVVLKGVSQGKAFIADPAKGHYRIQLYELAKKWHGETLIIGRDGFGLPQSHGLSHPADYVLAPERHTVRALQHTPLN